MFPKTSPARLCLIPLLALLFLDAGIARSSAGETWTPLANGNRGGTTLELLSDGSVLAMNGQQAWRLTPDSSGSYINGTWTQLASMNYSHVYSANEVVPSGNVVISGAEYGNGTSKLEWYNPMLNKWTNSAEAGGWADDPTAMLPNGTILFPGATYNPVTDSWGSLAGSYGWGGEDTYLELADGSILDAQGGGSQRFIPALNEWINDSNQPANSPLWGDAECGGGALLPDGRAFYVGATGYTDIYTPPSVTTGTGAWTAGPMMPTALSGTVPYQQGENDGPICMMTDGKVLCSAGPADSYGGPSNFYIYDPVANAFTQSQGAPSFGNGTYTYFFLALPDGTVLTSFGYIYNPGDSPVSTNHPGVTSVTQNADGSFLLSGTGLNGISEGGSYGDDHQMNSNYPLVRLTGTDSVVRYARTYNWSSTGVQTGTTPMSVDFTLPLGIPAGTYSLVEVGNGLASPPVNLTIPTAPGDIAPTVATTASSTSGTATTQMNLSALGASGSGESTLTYTWLNSAAPANVPAPSYSINGTNAAKNATLTFYAAGSYSFTVYITDTAGLSATSSVNVTVNQVLTSIAVSPALSPNLTAGQTQQFSATAYDQFGASMAPQPTFTWAVASGAGSVNGSGLYTTPGAGTQAVVTASASSVTGSGTADVVDAPWASADIGSPGIAGSAWDVSGTFTVNGEGNDIWNQTDQFHYVYQPLGGDGMIVARISGQQNSGNPKSGVMIRASLTGSSAHAFTCMDPGYGEIFEQRDALGGSTTYTQGPGSQAPYWLKLVRQGNLFTSQASPDGQTWTTVGTATIPMNSPAYIGLAVDSGNTGALCSSTFDHVSIMAANPVSASVGPGGATTINLLANATGPAGATLTLSNVTQGTVGTVVNNGNGTVTYTAGPCYATTDTFVYTVSDGLGDTATGTVTVSVAGLQAYWQFNDGAGSYAADSTGNGYTGLLNNGPAWTTGTINGALAFDGSSQFVNASISNVSETSYAVSLWFKSTSANCGLFEINNSPTGATGYDRDIWLSSGNIKAYVWQSNHGETISSSGVNFADGNWHQVVHTFGGTVGGEKLYVDGVLRASGANTYSGFNWENNINIGCSLVSSTPYFTGTMEEVRLYNTALSGSAVTALYTSSAPTVTSSASCSGTLGAYLPLNLSVSGSDSAGSGSLFYLWSVVSSPAGANVTFSSNDGDMSANPVATVSEPGTYTFQVVIADDNGKSATSTVTVIVPIPSGVWTNPAGGSWMTSGNWQGGGIPSGSGYTADFSTLTLTGSATVTLDGTETIGNLVFGDTATYGWTLNSGSGGPLLLSATAGSPMIQVKNQSATINAIISGTQGLTMSGTGTLTLGGANTYTGTTTVGAGTLSVTKSISSASPIVIGTSGATAAAIQIAMPSSVTLASVTTGSGATGSTLNVNQSNSTFLTIAGTSTLNSALTLSKSNSGSSWAGIAFNGITGPGAGSGNDTLIISNAGGWQAYLQGNGGAYTYGGNVHFLTSNGTDWRLQGMSIFPVTASITLDSGAVVRNNSNGTNFAFDALKGAGTWDTFNSTTSTLTIGSAGGSGTFSGIIENSAGTTNIVKTGTGTETFSGISTYKGSTTINGGTLNIAGSIANSTVTVNSGGTLTGSGTTGAVTVNSGGTLATGTFNLNNQALSLAGATDMQVNASTGGDTRVNGISTISYGGTLTVTNIAGTLAAGNSFTLFSASTYSGSFSNISLPSLPAGLYWNTSNLSVNGSISIVGQTFTSIAVSPATSALVSGSGEQFSATAYDQFNNPMVNQPAFAWSLSGLGSINNSGLYTASYASGSGTVQAASVSIAGTAGVTVTDAAPTVATAAAASPSPVTSTSTALSVLGADSDGGGEPNLTYTWAATAKPAGAADPTYSSNGANASKNTTATFTSAGSYTLQVTITDLGGQSATSSVGVTVNQTVNTIAVAPVNPSIFAGNSIQLSATASDQFGNVLTSQPGFTWNVTSGIGSVSSSGLYTAPTGNSGIAAVTASASGVSGTDTITVNLATDGIWINTAGGSWMTSGNWQGGGIPSGSGFTADFSTLTLSGNATVTLDGTETIGNLVFGDTAPYGWTLNSGSGGPLLLSATAGAPMIQVKNQSATISAVLSGTQGLTMSGTGTLTLGGTNTYTGTTTVGAGTLSVTKSISSASPVVIGTSGATAAAFQIALPSSATLASVTTGSGATGSTLNVNQSNSTFLTIAGTSTLNSALTLSKSNSGSCWAGIAFNGVTGPGAGSGNDTLIISNAGGWQAYVQGNGGAYTYGGNIHFLTSNGTDWRLQGLSIFPVTAGITLDSGAVVRNNSNGTNFAFDVLKGAGTWDTFNSTTSTLTIGSASGSGTFSGIIENSAGTTNVVKTGTGMETFSGACSYSGSTSINGGTLNIAGSIANSAVTVNNGAMLSGTGITGAVTVNAGGVIAPGVSGAGNLSLNNRALSLSGTAVVEVSASSGAATAVQNISSATYGGTLAATNLGGSFAIGNTYTLFGAASYSGSFASINLPSLPSGLSWNTSDLSVNGNIAVTGSLPAGWSGQDIGTVGVPGSSGYSGGVYTVNGSGADISGSADAFQYVSQTLTSSSDGEIRAQLTSQGNTNSLAKAGVMIRSGTGAGAVNAFVALTPGNGFVFQSRSTQSGTTSSSGTSSFTAPNNWVRLSKSGTLITGYISSSGTAWTQIGTVTITMTNNVTMGLAVTSHSNSAVSAAAFANVSITPFPAPWISADIGSPGLLGSAEYYNGVFTLHGAGNVGGTADNYHFAYQTLSGTGQVIAQITAPQNTGTNACLGVMVRSALTSNSPYAYIGINGGGTYAWQTRSSTGGATSITPLTTGTAPNIWVMLTLTGSSTFTGYTSASGTSWTQVGTANISMGTSTYMGMVDASGTTNTLNTTTFANPSVQ